MISLYQTRINVKRSELHSYNYDWNKLPDTLRSSHVPESYRVLYMKWTERADETDNGIIEIKLRHQQFSHETVARALRLFHKLNLAHLEKRGLGRGHGSTYQIRWSKAHKSIGERQRRKNHQNTGIRESVNCNKGRTSFTVKSSYSVQTSFELFKTNSQKSSLKDNEMKDFHPFQRKTSQNPPQNPQLVQPNSKTFRWGMAGIRAAVKAEFANKRTQGLVIEAFAIALKRAIAKHRLTSGKLWGELIRRSVKAIEQIYEDDFWPSQDDFEYLGGYCSWAGYVVKEAFSISSSQRRSLQYYSIVMSRESETLGVGQGS